MEKETDKKRRDMGWKLVNLKSDFRKGELEQPMRRDDLLISPDIPRLAAGTEVNIAYMDNLILVRSQDHKLEKVFFVGNSVWKKDFTDTYQKSEVFAKKIYSVAVPVDLLSKGKYKVVIQYDGKIYNTGKWFKL